MPADKLSAARSRKEAAFTALSSVLASAYAEGGEAEYRGVLVRDLKQDKIGRLGPRILRDLLTVLSCLLSGREAVTRVEALQGTLAFLGAHIHRFQAELLARSASGLNAPKCLALSAFLQC